MNTKNAKVFPIVIVSVLLVLLAVTAIFPMDTDFFLSQMLTRIDGLRGFSEVIEIWGEPPTLLVNSFVCALGAVFCFREAALKNKKAYYLLGSLSLVCGAVCAYMTASRTVKYYGEDLGDLLYVKLLVILFAVVYVAAGVFVGTRMKQDTLRKMAKVILFVAVAYVVSLIVINVIKIFWGRMRFREYVVSIEPVFSPWYAPQGIAASDAYKSFPSGHTSNAMLLLPSTYLFDSVGKKKAGTVARVALTVWVVLVMVTRIACGAHYLSDVSAGALLGFLSVVATGLVIFKAKKKA